MKIPLLSSLLRSGLLLRLRNGLKTDGLLSSNPVSVLFALFLFLFLFSSSFSAFAQFPYNESFKGPTAANVVFGGSPSAYLTAGTAPADAATPTSDAPGQGYLRLTNSQGNQKGFVYSNNVFLGTYGLNIEFEYFTYGGNGADGICFFLFDASVTDQQFNIGGFGGSLGYSQISPFVNGVSKGYLGIGIDEYGNFSDPGEDRQGGPKRIPNSVTLRGSGNGFDTNGQNYKFLITKETKPSSGGGFDIAGGLRGATPTDDGYRKAFISLAPKGDGTLLINVKIQHGSTVTTVIENYNYDKPIPASGLKYGISSSTGGSNNYHEIRGLSLTVDPNKLADPVARPDKVNICQGYPVDINIFNNDTFPNANGGPNKDKVDLDPDVAGIQQTKVTAKGTFTFLPDQLILRYVPFAGSVDDDVISYNFLDIYGAQSNTTQVTVTTILPVITRQPDVSTTVCENKPFSLSVDVTGTGVQYQWQYLAPGQTIWQNVQNGNGITGATTREIKSSSTPLAYNGYQYRVILSSSTCNVTSTTGLLNVDPNTAISLSSAAGTDAQSICITNPITTITYAIANGMGASVSGLPAGVTGNYANGVFTISGTPTVTGTFNYTVSATGKCTNPTATGTITVNPNTTLTLTSGANSDGQTVCISSAIQNITYAVTAGTASVSGLPAGVNGTYLNGVLTISGAPTVSGVFTYMVTTTGNCLTPSMQGTITVNPNTTITLSSAAGTNAQTKCINNAITDISYTVTDGTGATVTGLPTGVTGDFAGGVFTISGTPSVSGTFNYTITATGTCTNPTATGTITVNPNTTLTLSSGANSDGQTVCISTAIQNITYAVTDGDAAVTGLPAGVNGTYLNGVLTISGAPTASGVFTYTVTTSGNCLTPSMQGTITVNPNTTIVLSSAVGTNAQTKCINNAITDITYAVTNGTGATVTGLPTGVTGDFAGGVFTISGTSSVSGTFNYTVTATGTCTNPTATGTITVNPNTTLTLTSGTNSDGQTVCISTAIQNITYAVTAGTAAVTGLPAGVNGTYLNGVLTISGAPTASGVFTYTVTTSGNCVTPTMQGTITVNPNTTIVLSSAVGTNAQTKCINNAITDITYTVTDGTGATVTGLPTGVTGDFAGGVFTISGTPSVSGTFNYTVTATGTCTNPTATGTITVNPNTTLTLSSGANSDGQTVCISTAIQNITYAVTDGTAAVTGLPAGVNGTYLNGVLTISGAPTVSGTFTYTVTTTGNCLTPTMQGTITVNPNTTIVLSSAVGTNAQTKCINNAITDITYTVTDGTGATVTGLPTGVTGDFAGGVFTISGTPSVSGTFNYTVTATGTCTNPTATGTITVNPNTTLTLSSGANSDAQTVCISTAIQNITYAVTDGDAAVTGLPAGVNGTYLNGVLTISGAPTVSGTFTYTVTTTGNCLTPTMQGTITVNPNTTIVLSSAVGTNAQTKCINNAITDITYAVTNGTGATVTGLPTGVTGDFAGGVFTISGTPSVSGTFNYTVTATGICTSPTISGTITVNPNTTLTLTSGANSDGQTVCISTAIQNITYIVTDGDAAVTGLPAGVNGTYLNGLLTISGAPTASGVFTYTVTTTGNCLTLTMQGTITVNPNTTLVLTSPNQTKAQTVCINTAIQDITYAVTDGTAAVTGLPNGMNGTYANGVLTISGTPDVSGTFTYTVTTTGNCVTPTMQGTITVNPNTTIDLTSGPGSDRQTVCINNAINAISYTLTNATNATVTDLPAGVNGTFTGGILTISGTPAVSGLFTYTITTSGNCVTPTMQGTITVNPNTTLVLTSPNQTKTQTVCVNTAIQDITYEVTDGTAAVTGLPNGVNAVYVNNVLTISGSPAAAGTYTYTVTTTGNCVTPTMQGTITVNPNTTLTLTSGGTSDTQTLCVNAAINTITYQVTDGTATVTGLPAGVNGTYLNNVLTISGSPAVAGTYPYTVTTSGNCVTPTMQGTITVNPNTTIVLTSANQTKAQRVCINTSIQDIVYTVTDGAVGTIIGLPNGLTSNFVNGVLTITGTPAESGTFNYTITTTGSCLTPTEQGEIIVRPNTTLTLNTAGSETQTVCVNNPINTITYTLTNETNAVIIGLPAGVNGTYTNGLVTISGTPVLAGTYTYTITTSGNCFTPTAQGTITVNPNTTINLSSAFGTDAQTVCIGKTIENIVYTVTDGTGASVSGLPDGLTGNYAGGIFTISGAATESGTFNYIISTTGNCITPTIGGKIIIDPNTTIALTSANATDAQTVCINTGIQDIVYTVTNGTGAVVTGLPAGLTSSYNNGIFTITGTPSASGIFNYTIATSGKCDAPAISGTITVNPDVTISLSSAPATVQQDVCINTSIRDIIYTITNGTGATVTPLPAGLTGIFANGKFTISGTPTVAGTFSYTVTTTGGCSSARLSGTMTIKPDAIITLATTANDGLCINIPLNDIIYKVENATGAIATGLPAGVTGRYNSSTKEFTINGSPNTSGTFNYTVTTTGGCAPASITGILIVNPNTTLQISSPAATANQTVCVDNAIRNITYQATEATNGEVTGLPAGVTGTFANGIFTISGTPSATGTFNYTVTAVGICKTIQLSGTITVNPRPTGFNDVITNLSCGNTSFSYNLQDNVNNTAKGGNGVLSSFTWTAVPNRNIAGIANGSGTALSATLYNLSNTIQQVVYTVTPTSLNGTCPGATFTVTVNVPVCSGLSITKTANVSSVNQAGDEIRYTITVRNTATASQTRVTVTDPLLGGVLAVPASGDNGNGILEANEAWVYTGVYRVSQSDIDNYGKPNAGTGTIVNTATVNSFEHPETMSAVATVNIFTGGSISLVKTGVLKSDFSTITYTFRITNTGNVRLNNLKLTDTKISGSISLSTTTLEVGASVNATAVYTVTDGEKRDGQVLNTATVTATNPSGNTVHDISGTESNNDDPTVHIIDDAPQALNDHAETKINQPVTVGITGNDLPSYNGLDKGSIIITRYPSNGQVQINSDGTIVYTPNRGYSGPDDFAYTINDLKGKVSNVALVSITIVPIDLFIPNTFTPNGDGKNDTFKIIGRESFDSLNLLIFNRWGNEVYRNTNYQDEWDGSGLNEGTYYYLLTLKKGGNEVTKKGWILLKR